MNSDKNPSSPEAASTADETLAELQSRMAFQEDTLHSLNQVIATQDASIARLQKQMQVLNTKLNDLATAVDESTGSDDQEVPPHY